DAGRTLVSRILGLEIFLLRSRGAPRAFAAATASWRNPIFLSFRCRGFRKNARNDPSLIPLVLGPEDGGPALFYHYRKQRILKNVDESLLFFPAVDPNVRPDSFRGLDSLTDSLVSEWDSRIEQRSRMLAGKVLVPLLAAV
ncbi:MAG: hypothetical protein ACYTFI_16225, partial [Planctomycetota bacterium]